MLNDRVIPFFAEHQIDILRILTDRGTEYCGTLENHAYQLYLSVEGIEHTRTKANSPQTNGICERFHKTMKQEFYDTDFRKKIYHSLEELQQDVDSWLIQYNNHSIQISFRQILLRKNSHANFPGFKAYCS